jgi:hypothetical protein
MATVAPVRTRSGLCRFDQRRGTHGPLWPELIAPAEELLAHSPETPFRHSHEQSDSENSGQETDGPAPCEPEHGNHRCAHTKRPTERPCIARQELRYRIGSSGAVSAGSCGRTPALVQKSRRSARFDSGLTKNMICIPMSRWWIAIRFCAEAALQQQTLAEQILRTGVPTHWGGNGSGNPAGTEECQAVKREEREAAHALS